MNERTQNTFRFICKLIAAFFITIAVFMTYPSGIVIVTAMLYRLFDSQSMIMLIGCTLAIIVFICRGCFAFPRMKNDIKNHYKQDSESAIRIKSVIFFACQCASSIVVTIPSFMLYSSFSLPVIGAIFVVIALLLTWYRIWKQGKKMRSRQQKR